MDHASAMEEQVVTERIRRKLEEVNAAAQQHLAGVQDHVNFTMQVRALVPASVSVYLLGSGQRERGNLGILGQWSYAINFLALVL